MQYRLINIYPVQLSTIRLIRQHPPLPCLNLRRPTPTQSITILTPARTAHPSSPPHFTLLPFPSPFTPLSLSLSFSLSLFLFISLSLSLQSLFLFISLSLSFYLSLSLFNPSLFLSLSLSLSPFPCIYFYFFFSLLSPSTSPLPPFFIYPYFSRQLFILSVMVFLICQLNYLINQSINRDFFSHSRYFEARLAGLVFVTGCWWRGAKYEEERRLR